MAPYDHGAVTFWTGLMSDVTRVHNAGQCLSKNQQLPLWQVM